MRFFSNSSIPSFFAKWHQVGMYELRIGDEPVLISEVAPTIHYRVLAEISAYNYELLYHGTDLVQAKKVQDSAKDRKTKFETSQGLPDFNFSLDRSMGKPPYVTAHSNEANGCLLVATVNGSYGFEASTDGEILAEYLTEKGRSHGSGTLFTVIAVLLPEKRLTIKYSGVGTGQHRSQYVWDGTHMETEVGDRAEKANPTSPTPWSALDKLNLK